MKKEFSLLFDLKSGVDPILPQGDLHPKIIPSFKIEKPVEWKKEWGDFNLALRKLYNVYFQGPFTKDEKTPLMILAKHGKAVTGDVDLFALGVPAKKLGQFEYTQLLMHNHVPALLEAVLFQLCREYKMYETVWKSTPKDFIPHTGILTAYELFVIACLNYNVSLTLIRLFTVRLVQHGPDVNHPGDPSPLDDDVLHIHGDNII